MGFPQNPHEKASARHLNLPSSTTKSSRSTENYACSTFFYVFIILPYFLHDDVPHTLLCPLFNDIVCSIVTLH